MISRIWHGWASPENADAYENLLSYEIFEWIDSPQINGYKGIQLHRRAVEKEVEFITILWFDSLESVRQFAGEVYESAVVLLQAQRLMAHYDAMSQQYEVRVDHLAA